MEVNLSNVVCKQNDFKICCTCGALNWYENEICRECNTNKFDESNEAVTRFIEEEYSCYEYYGYTEEEIDNIFLEV